MMVNLYKETMDPTLAIVGQTIEPKIRQYVEQKTGIKYRSYDPKKINFDLFSNDHVFGGIPDGEPVDANDQLLYPQMPMLEIKTSSIDAFWYKKNGSELVMQKDENGYPIVKEPNKKRNS